MDTRMDKLRLACYHAYGVVQSPLLCYGDYLWATYMHFGTPPRYPFDSSIGIVVPRVEEPTTLSMSPDMTFGGPFNYACD